MNRRFGRGREDVGFQCGGQRLAAWLYRSEAPPPQPCVVLGHGFGLTREAGLDAYARRFAAAGVTALAFDYRHWGGSEGDPRQLFDPARQRADWHAAIGFARSIEGVDPQRVAAWGFSVGGGHVIRLAAEDPRLAAAVAQMPFVEGLTMPRLQGIPKLLRLTALALRDVASRTTVPMRIAGPPGSLAGLTTPDAEEAYATMLPAGADWQNSVPARGALLAALFRPIRHARRVACPLLVCAAEHDAIAFPDRARRAAALAPRAELRTYPGGHFDAFFGRPMERCVIDQVAFLRRELSVEGVEDRVELGHDVA